MQKKKIEVIVYHQDLIGPFMEAFKTNSIFATPKEENNPGEISKRMSLCRAYYELKNFDLIIRCIEDILPPEAQGVPYSNKRNAEEIYELLCGYIKYDSPDLVIVVDTASSLKLDVSLNGCIYMGGQYFSLDAKEYDPSSVSKLKPYVYSVSEVNDEIFDILSDDEKKEVASKFKTLINSPADVNTFNLSKNYCCFSYANVFDIATFYSKQRLTEFEDMISKVYMNTVSPEIELVSGETIEGVVNMVAIKVKEQLNKKISTIFLSAISCRPRLYQEDVDSEGKQESGAIYNGGISLSAFLEKLDSNMTNSEINYF